MGAVRALLSTKKLGRFGQRNLRALDRLTPAQQRVVTRALGYGESRAVRVGGMNPVLHVLATNPHGTSVILHGGVYNARAVHLTERRYGKGLSAAVAMAVEENAAHRRYAKHRHGRPVARRLIRAAKDGKIRLLHTIKEVAPKTGRILEPLLLPSPGSPAGLPPALWGYHPDCPLRVPLKSPLRRRAQTAGRARR